MIKILTRLNEGHSGFLDLKKVEIIEKMMRARVQDFNFLMPIQSE